MITLSQTRSRRRAPNNVNVRPVPTLRTGTVHVRSVSASRSWQMPRHPGGQEVYEIRIHETVVIRDVQADDALAA